MIWLFVEPVLATFPVPTLDPLLDKLREAVLTTWGGTGANKGALGTVTAGTALFWTPLAATFFFWAGALVTLGFVTFVIFFCFLACNFGGAAVVLLFLRILNLLSALLT